MVYLVKPVTSYISMGHLTYANSANGQILRHIERELESCRDSIVQDKRRHHSSNLTLVVDVIGNR